MPRTDGLTGLLFSTVDEIMDADLGQPIHGWGGGTLVVQMRGGIAESGTAELVIATDDGRRVDVSDWCAAVKAGREVDSVYYERFTAEGRMAHGWICSHCRKLVQTG